MPVVFLLHYISLFDDLLVVHLFVFIFSFLFFVFSSKQPELVERLKKTIGEEEIAFIANLLETGEFLWMID